MTGATILNAKGLGSIVTSPAGFAGLHVFHVCRVSSLSWLKWARVTAFAVKHFNMCIMWEDRFAEPLIIYVSGMASGTIFLDAKRSVAIMAGSTGRPFFHLLHPHLVAVGFGIENAGMAFIATEHVDMCRMGELDHTNALGLNKDLINGIAVTGGTVTFDTECRVTIMTRPAGRSFFHLLHSHLIAVSFCLKDVGVTFVAAEHAGM